MCGRVLAVIIRSKRFGVTVRDYCIAMLCVVFRGISWHVAARFTHACVLIDRWMV
jgi:hypothetical protein